MLIYVQLSARYVYDDEKYTVRTYRVAQKTGPAYLIANIVKTPWLNCVKIGELLQYYNYAEHRH